MSGEIVNRIEKSKLITVDLADYYPKGKRLTIDVSQWLFNDLVLKEKEFRTALENYNWAQYKEEYVALICTSEAIIPSWAYLLITVKLKPYAKKIVVGSLSLLDSIIFHETMLNIKLDQFKNKPIIIKGCSDKNIPESAPVWLLERLLPIAKSVMFGEACSSVPLYKSKK
jgi:hypothetical protein